jgi:hypothetical protein
MRVAPNNPLHDDRGRILFLRATTPLQAAPARELFRYAKRRA